MSDDTSPPSDPIAAAMAGPPPMKCTLCVVREAAPGGHHCTACLARQAAIRAAMNKPPPVAVKPAPAPAKRPPTYIPVTTVVRPKAAVPRTSTSGEPKVCSQCKRDYTAEGQTDPEDTPSRCGRCVRKNREQLAEFRNRSK